MNDKQSAMDTLRQLDRTTSSVTIRVVRVFAGYYDRGSCGFYVEDIQFVTEDEITAKFLANPKSGFFYEEGMKLNIHEQEGFVLQFSNISTLNFVILPSYGLFSLQARIPEEEMTSIIVNKLRASALQKLTFEEATALGVSKPSKVK